MAFKNRYQGHAYTCANRRFHTDITKGHQHKSGGARGSVFQKPIIEDGSYSLWLEHVVDEEDGRDVFWLMWYDKSGSPTIPLSGVFEAADIRQMAARLAAYIQVP